MGFSVPATLPPAPAYGLPPNVIRASYALNLIKTDAFIFATSRRKIANLFIIYPLPAGAETKVANFLYYPLPTATGTLDFVFYGANLELMVSEITASINVTVSAGANDVYTGQISGLSSTPQWMQVAVTDRGNGFLGGFYLFETHLTAGDLP